MFRGVGRGGEASRAVDPAILDGGEYELVSHLPVGRRNGILDVLPQAGGPEDVKGFLPAAEAERLDQTGESQHMVAVHMGYEYPAQLHERERRHHQLPLDALAAIQEHYVPVGSDGDARRVPLA